MTCSRWRALSFAICMAAFAPRAGAEDEAFRLAPKGELRVGVVQANAALVARSNDGQFRGVANDVATALGDKIGVKVRLVPYENQTRYNQSIGQDEWDIAIGFRDLSRTGALAFTNALMEVDNGFIVRPGRGLLAAADVDRVGIKVAVIQGSTADGSLTRSIKFAELVRISGGRTSAKEALSSGRADVYADSIVECYRLAAELPGSTVLVGRFNTSQMVIAVTKANAAKISELNDFIADLKRTGGLGEAIKRAGLRGARLPR